MSPTAASPGLDAACDADDDAFVRRVNLLEILAEDRPETAPPPEEAARTWTEARIHAHYHTGGANGGSRDEVCDRLRTEPEVESRGRDLSGKATTDEETLPPREETETTSAPAEACRRRRVRSNRPRFPDPDDDTFRRWFPGFERANAGLMTEATDETAKNTKKKNPPKARVLCWPNAGNAEDVFTSERARVDGKLHTVPSPLLSWCRANETELFAVQLPGRGARSREPAFECACDAARALMAIVARRFFYSEEEEDEGSLVPWIVVGHSVGSWCAFEFVRLAASLGFHKPASACLSGFPAPDISCDQRPWRVNRTLNDSEFKHECRLWGVDEAAFKVHAWRAFEPLLRADFTLFDEYEYDSGRVASEGSNTHAKLTNANDITVDDSNRCGVVIDAVFPRLLTLRGTRDERVTNEAVLNWRRFSFVDKKETDETDDEKEVSYRHVEIEGARHLLLTQPEFKSEWLRAVADEIADAVVR